MSSFTSPLQYTPLADGNYLLDQPFRFYLSDEMTGDYIDVPTGTIFNGASIPKLVTCLTSWDPMDDRWLQASVLHDALVGEITPKILAHISKQDRELSWQESADVFANALEVRTRGLRFRRFQRHVIVFAVRIYGFLR
jgi:hypothetical protein